MNKINIGGNERQREIYINGISGTKSPVPFDFQLLKSKAKEKLSPEAAAYIMAGAGMEDTMKQNRKDFNSWRILPRMLRDVSSRDIAVTLFNKKYPTPLLTCPIGVLEMAHKDADLGVAKATAQLGVPMIFSNQASVPMEKCAEVMGDAPRWFSIVLE